MLQILTSIKIAQLFQTPGFQWKVNKLTACIYFLFFFSCILFLEHSEQIPHWDHCYTVLVWFPLYLLSFSSVDTSKQIPTIKLWIISQFQQSNLLDITNLQHCIPFHFVNLDTNAPLKKTSINICTVIFLQTLSSGCYWTQKPFIYFFV